MGRFLPLCSIIFFLLTIGTSRAENPPAPDYSHAAPGYHLPLNPKVNFDDLKSLHVRVSINGGPAIRLLVDTGSVGVVVGATDVPDIDPNAPAGSITYSSSGIELDGVWTPVTLTFPDARDSAGHAATARVPVLAVRERKASGVGVNSAGTSPSKNPHPFMLGVGFGRGKEPHPERNPFLNLSEMQAGKMIPGYTITRDGITLGLGGADITNGYIFQKLKERPLPDDISKKFPGLHDWMSATGSFSIDTYHSASAAVLMDTGLTNMILSDPAHAQTADAPADVPAGTPVTVNLLDGKLRYSFVAADKNDPASPRRITWVNSHSGVRINTGLRAFSLFDYLFDNQNGYLALRPRNLKKG